VGLQGRPVQVDPIDPVLKAPATKRLKLKVDELLSSSAFEFNLRRYIKGLPATHGTTKKHRAHGRGLHSSTSQLNLSCF